MRGRQEFVAASFITLLAACGGGGGGGSVAPPTSLSYSTPPAFTVHQTITPLTPTVAGASSSSLSFSVTPALPEGLTLSAATGIISGTPTAVTAKQTYTVTVKNAGGSVTDGIAIVVDDVAPKVAYLSAYYSFTVGIVAKTDTPTTTGGAVTAWTISPALPAGLTLDASTGVISGTPSAAASAANYTVTATNSGGSVPIVLTLSVAGAPILDVGHAAQVSFVGFSGGSLLTEDTSGHWALWNYATDKELASGSAVRVTLSSVAIAGPIAVVQTLTGLQVLNATTGAAQGFIAAGIPTWFSVASDGSYVCAGTSSALRVWSPSGQLLITHPGNYSEAVAYAAHGQVQVASGPAGANVIEVIDVLTGTSSVTPQYQGAFAGWFNDGSHFLSTVGGSSTTTVYVFTPLAQQQEILGPMQTAVALGGVGNDFWIFSGATHGGYTLDVYAVGGSATPLATYSYSYLSDPTLYASGTTLGVLQQDPQAVQVIDLSGATPTASSATLPLANISAFGAASSAAWVVGNNLGVLLDGASLSGTPRYIDEGQVMSIAGSPANFAVATASGRILVYAASGNALLTTIEFGASQLALSADGTVLVALDTLAQTVEVFALPIGTLTNTLTFGSPGVASLTASGSGAATELGLALNPPLSLTTPAPPCYAEVIAANGTTPSFCYTAGNAGAVFINNDGSQVTVAALPSTSSNASTNIYSLGTLSGAVAAYALGWLTTDTFIAKTYYLGPEDGGYLYQNAVIDNAMGVVQATIALPDPDYTVQVLSPTSIYLPSSNAVFALPAGTETWASGSTPSTVGPQSLGAVSGSEVIFPVGTDVLAESLGAGG